MSDRTIWRRTEPKRHQRTQLAQVSSVRVVGFQDAVDDLGTHTMHGHEVKYSRGMVFNVLKGVSKSEKLLTVIAKKRPDMFLLHYVHEDVLKWVAEHIGLITDGHVLTQILNVTAEWQRRRAKDKGDMGACASACDSSNPETK